MPGRNKHMPVRQASRLYCRWGVKVKVSFWNQIILVWLLLPPQKKTTWNGSFHLGAKQIFGSEFLLYACIIEYMSCFMLHWKIYFVFQVMWKTLFVSDQSTQTCPPPPTISAGHCFSICPGKYGVTCRVTNSSVYTRTEKVFWVELVPKWIC